MTNHFTYPSHNKPLYQCNLWKNQQSHAAIRNHCNHATITNHFTQATHDKLFYILLSIRQLISPIPHMKKHYTHVPMTNHCNYAIIRNPFSHTTISPILCHLWPTISHLPSFKSNGPIPPGQTISPILSMTYHLSETKKVFHPLYVSLQRRDISLSLLFWQWLRSCRYRFVSPSPLTFLRITQHCI